MKRKNRITLFVITLMLCMLFTGTAALAKGKKKTVPKISSKAITLTVGKTKTVSVKNYNKKIKWSSSNKAVARVNSKGKVIAKNKGTAFIIAKAGNKRLTCKVTVKGKPAQVQKVTIPRRLVLIAGEEYLVSAKTKPTQLLYKVKWSSSDDSIASVTGKTGMITANKAGKVKITARAGKKYATCIVTVKKFPAISSVSIIGTSADGSQPLMVGASTKLSLNVNSQVARGFKWSTSNPAVATVDQAGRVQGVGAGTAIITAFRKTGTGKPMISLSTTVVVQANEAGKNTAGAGKAETSSKVHGSIVGITAASSLKEAEKISDVTANTITVKTVYQDGTQEDAGNYSYRGELKDGYFVFTVTTGDGKYTATFSVKKVAPKRVMTEIVATCSMKEAENINQVTADKITVTSKYNDGTSEELKQYSIIGSTSKDGKTFLITVSADNGRLTSTFSVKKKEAVKTVTSINAECKVEAAETIRDITPSDITVMATYSDGTTGRVTAYSLTGKTSEDGQSYIYTVTTEDGKQSCTFSVEKKQKEEQKPDSEILTGIRAKISGSISVGDDISNVLSVTAVMKDGSEKNVTAESSSDFQPKSEAGEYPVKVTYQGLSADTTVVVLDLSKKLTGVDIKFQKPSVYMDEDIQMGDIAVTGTYADGHSEAVTDFTFDVKKATSDGGNTEITVTVPNIGSQTVSVPTYDRNKVTHAEISVQKLEYHAGEAVDRSTIKVTGTTRDGRTVEITNFAVSPETVTAGINQITVSAAGFSEAFDIAVTQ